ncbi:hypothetical protein ArV1_063 [Arthrobacter phage vB_ArtM-ArV1]|uniref:Terminase small subunit n=1 Tax=Arthrobacter phage vB_ArtM-ArV1 TaxID=1566993 RepID=A0A0A7HBV7_9CAUD|nr:hypothetical protein ArV1_063 [Arthrobacter phage vB_ArtM-ArV1]AIZ01751.1 hypothetical protein ArV1_063 [Arthrobacter phage vB_ArtM-ArV1]
MNSNDFQPRPAGDVVPDPFVEGSNNRWMPFDPIKAAMGYHAARALAYHRQTELEPGNTNAVALMVTEYHIASLYYAQVTGGMTRKGCIGFNKGMRERPEATLHNIIHMLTFLGVDPREIRPFVSPETDPEPVHVSVSMPRSAVTNRYRVNRPTITPADANQEDQNNA